jgi:hypothetical protein
VADADRSARFEWDYLDVIKTLFAERFRAHGGFLHGDLLRVLTARTRIDE